MSDEKQESRIMVEDLPAREKELTPEEAQGIQGGADTKKTSQYIVMLTDASGKAT